MKETNEITQGDSHFYVNMEEGTFRIQNQRKGKRPRRRNHQERKN